MHLTNNKKHFAGWLAPCFWAIATSLTLCRTKFQDFFDTQYTSRKTYNVAAARHWEGQIQPHLKRLADTPPLEGLLILRCAIYDPVEGLQNWKMTVAKMGVQDLNFGFVQHVAHALRGWRGDVITFLTSIIHGPNMPKLPVIIPPFPSD